MAGINAVEPGDSTALLRIDFEFGKTVADPSLTLVECGRPQWSWDELRRLAPSLLQIRSINERSCAMPLFSYFPVFSGIFPLFVIHNR